MPRRPILPADDSAAHAAWIAEALAAEFHFPRLLPILKRRAEPEPRLPDLFIDLLDLQVTQTGATEAAPAPTAFAEEELVEIEACLPFRYAYGPEGDAARERWIAWISDGATVETVSVPLKGKRNHTVVKVTRTRLGWLSSYDFNYPDSGGVGGGGSGPHRDIAGFYVWADREAAIQCGAHTAWSSAIHPTPRQTSDARAGIAVGIQAEFEKLGIDVTAEPSRDRRRRLVTEERMAELRCQPAAEVDAEEPAMVAEESASVADTPTMAVGMPIDTLLRTHFGEALPGPSALTAKRRERRRQREAEAVEKVRRDRELPPLDPGVVMREPELADQVEVMEALYEAVPRGVPHHHKATLAVHRSPGRIIADVRLFDDEVGRVEISGSKGARGYRWHYSGVAGTAFHWNEGARCWERIPDPSELA